MMGINYFKADASTYVIRSVQGKIRAQGKGLSFFYMANNTSIAALPLNAQDAPFIFNLQTGDFQEVAVQGQITFRIAEPEKTAGVLNYTVTPQQSYVSEDPLYLTERVIRTAQALVQNRIDGLSLRETLALTDTLSTTMNEGLAAAPAFLALGLDLLDVNVLKIAPTPETARALEAHTREAILQEADDATYSRRKSAVEQERTIREAELDTDRSVQEKEQEIEARRIENERDIFRSQQQTDRERLQAEIEAEQERQALVEMRVANRNQEADADAYAIEKKMAAFQALPVDHLRAMAQAQMQPDQLMAMAMESFAQNAHKIGELNIAPELLQQGLTRAARRAAQKAN